jgi:hypothetical protein
MNNFRDGFFFLPPFLPQMFPFDSGLFSGPDSEYLHTQTLPGSYHARIMTV